MPPFVALAAGVALLTWLLRADFRQRDAGTSALWIPGLLILINGSRPVSYWFDMLGFTASAQNDAESSPVNALLYATILVSSFIVLLRRRINWARLASFNKALFALYLFYLVSSLWSPNPPVTARRIFKDFGNLLVALVILTEADPKHAMRAIFVRAAYFLLPLSLVTSKYYPNIGRYMSRSWEAFYTGLTTHKNTLGLVSLLCILFLVWDLIMLSGTEKSPVSRLAKRQKQIALAIGISLIVMAHSATAQICLLLGVSLLLIFRKLALKPTGRSVFKISLLAILTLALADKTLGISESIAEAFGRNMTLTGRTIIWDVVLDHQDRPLLGFGYYAFWDTPIAFTIYEEAGDLIHIRTVHNGYIEVFIDGGIVGVILLAIYLGSRAIYCYKTLFDDPAHFAMPMVVLVIALLYNNSESSFFRSDMLWLTFLLLTTRCDRTCFQADPASIVHLSSLRYPVTAARRITPKKLAAD